MTYTPLKVELPCCPTCGMVSKVAVQNYPGQSFCLGRRGERHKRTRMESKTFVEVREGEGASS